MYKYFAWKSLIFQKYGENQQSKWYTKERDHRTLRTPTEGAPWNAHRSRYLTIYYLERFTTELWLWYLGCSMASYLKINRPSCRTSSPIYKRSLVKTQGTRICNIHRLQTIFRWGKQEQSTRETAPCSRCRKPDLQFHSLHLTRKHNQNSWWTHIFPRNQADEWHTARRSY